MFSGEFDLVYPYFILGIQIIGLISSVIFIRYIKKNFEKIHNT